MAGAINNATAIVSSSLSSKIGLWDQVTNALRSMTLQSLTLFIQTQLNSYFMPLVAPGTTGNVLTSNGSSWTSAAPIGRTTLTTNTTYYVSTTGNNTTGDGSSGNPWQTVQYALNFLITKMDLSGYTVTIQCADGTYANAIVVSEWVGGGKIIVQGDPGNMNSVIFSANNCITSTTPISGEFSIAYVKFTGAGSGNLSLNGGGGILTYGNVNFAGSPTWHMWSNFPGARIRPNANYTISAAPTNNHIALFGGNWSSSGSITITISGTPAWGNAFVTVQNASVCEFGTPTVTFSGSATGSRYNVSANGVIQTYGQASTWLPGNAAGTTATGGQYA